MSVTPLYEEFLFTARKMGIPKVYNTLDVIAAGGTIQLASDDLITGFYLGTNGVDALVLLPPVESNPRGTVYTIYLLYHHSGETVTIDSPPDCRVASPTVVLVEDLAGQPGCTASYINRGDRYEICPDIDTRLPI